MKVLEVRNYKHFAAKAAKQYETTIQQIKDIADDLGCTIFVQTRKMYSKDYNYYLISKDDIYKVLAELEARKDSLQQPVKRQHRVCRDDKVNWLKEQGATVDINSSKPNRCTVSMYNGAIIKHFNLSCSMQNIQDYFDKCFKKHPETTKEDTESASPEIAVVTPYVDTTGAAVKKADDDKAGNLTSCKPLLSTEDLADLRDMLARN